MISKIAVCYDIQSKRMAWVAYPQFDDSEIESQSAAEGQAIAYLPFDLLEDSNGHLVPGARVTEALEQLIGKAEPEPYNGPAPIPDNNTNPEL